MKHPCYAWTSTCAAEKRSQLIYTTSCFWKCTICPVLLTYKSLWDGVSTVKFFHSVVGNTRFAFVTDTSHVTVSTATGGSRSLAAASGKINLAETQPPTPESAGAFVFRLRQLRLGCTHQSYTSQL